MVSTKREDRAIRRESTVMFARAYAKESTVKCDRAVCAVGATLRERANVLESADEYE